MDYLTALDGPECRRLHDTRDESSRMILWAAENSMRCHAPAEAARMLAESIDFSRQAQLRARALPAGSRAPTPAEPPRESPAASPRH
jgi:Cytochrome c552